MERLILLFSSVNERQPKGLQRNEEAVLLSNNFGKPIRKQLKVARIFGKWFVAKPQPLVVRSWRHFTYWNGTCNKKITPFQTLQLSVTDRCMRRDRIFIYNFKYLWLRVHFIVAFFEWLRFCVSNFHILKVFIIFINDQVFVTDKHIIYYEFILKCVIIYLFRS